MTVGSPPSMTATTELVVPKSIPMILPISFVLQNEFWPACRHPVLGCVEPAFLTFLPRLTKPLQAINTLVEWNSNIICEPCLVNFDNRAFAGGLRTSFQGLLRRIQVGHRVFGPHSSVLRRRRCNEGRKAQPR